MPVYRLTYTRTCNVEPIKALFSLAGITYDSKVVSTEDWDDIETGSVWPNPPLLEVSGRVFGGISTISRYVAKLTGFAGKTVVEATIADGVVDLLENATKSGEFNTDDTEELYDSLQKVLMSNKGGTEYFAGKSISYADLWFYCAVYQITKVTDASRSLSKYKKLRRLYLAILEDERLEEYIAGLRVDGAERQEEAKQRSLKKAAAVGTLTDSRRVAAADDRDRRTDRAKHNAINKLNALSNMGALKHGQRR